MHLYVEPGSPIEGRLDYSEDEYSFGFKVTSTSLIAEREGSGGRASVSIGTLQVEVGASTGKALFVWGLHPHTTWIEGKLGSPSFSPGVATFDARFDTSVSRLIAAVGEWSTIFDRSTGWLRVAPGRDPEEALTEIATGILLGVRLGELSSVWLKLNGV
ncbi:hypothetical protein GCM10017581_076690 [Dactylosporangium matsuzakiense]|uniref:Uncharacterized protein n=1 Tax=Dactylosporangium matsuzakiense TaxID=53360 RepID=A0A9W6NR52_9ACTN|nr:hypothetical protein GCM10017581_076690 [Dactylosporangium matsuzakiense]